jgi:hypothetical protein
MKPGENQLEKTIAPKKTGAEQAPVLPDKPTDRKEYKGKPAGKQVSYSGEVQGVGLRATAERMARDYPVTGSQGFNGSTVGSPWITVVMLLIPGQQGPGNAASMAPRSGKTLRDEKERHD